MRMSFFVNLKTFQELARSLILRREQHLKEHPQALLHRQDDPLNAFSSIALRSSINSSLIIGMYSPM